MKMKWDRVLAAALSLALGVSLLTVPGYAASFTDIDTHWAKEYIEEMYAKGLAKGYGNTDENGASLGTYSFKPEGKMTAAETLLFCARATGVSSGVQKQIAADRAEEMEEILPESMISWAAAEMAVAVETGVLSLAELEALSAGDALGKTITRETICMYLVRAMQLEPLARSLSNYSLAYVDAGEISPALQPYVYVLTNFGIVKGTDTGEFDPKGAVTRAQMTTMLCRALEFMEDSGITVELPEYTDYSWQAGTISVVTQAGDGSTIVTLTSEFDETRSYAVSNEAVIYQDNMTTTVRALKVGQYARLNLAENGMVKEVRLGGVLTTYTGAVANLEDDTLTLLVDDRVRELTIDRFTKVMVGKTAGDRSIIDYNAGYTSATCYVDEMGHLAGVQLTGGTQLVSGLMESMVTSAGKTTIGVTQFNGVVYRYTVPAGIATTVDGVLQEINDAYVGDYVTLRVGIDSGEAVSVAVSTAAQYVQGPIRRQGVVGTTKSVVIGDVFTGSELSLTVAAEAEITYNGEAKTVDEIQNGWYVTAQVAGQTITNMEAYSGSVTVTGTLTSIDYGDPTVIAVTQADDTVVTYQMDLAALPTVTRESKASTVDKLRTGDNVTITIRYNKVERIDATAQSANLTATVNKLTLESGGVTMELRLNDGTVAEYTVPEGIAVTQNGSSSSIYSIKPGYTLAMVVSGGEIVSIDITSVAASTNSISGTVYTVNHAGSVRTITILVTDAMGRTTPVNMDVGDATLLDINGRELSIRSGFTNGDPVIAYGSYEGAQFIATIVIKQ